ncbi:MAG: hypothetical protein JW783_00390 [Bacteroidales bacterium]|nr:hypothetical protein [Bacteroidales bacterium]MBN2748479.1 hypothetical protein [Bacteroidales bacterium]
MATLEELNIVAQRVVDEQQPGGNTKERVGGLFKDIIAYFNGLITTINQNIASLSNSVTSLSNDVSLFETSVANKLDDAPINGEAYVRSLADWERLRYSTDYVDSLSDAFAQIYIRNTQFDNVNNLATETKWQVTAHDTVGKWLTLNNPIPRIPGLLNIDVNNQWALYYDYYKSCNIAEVDWVNNKIRYTATDDTGGIVNGNYVAFFNPFQRASLISRAPLFGSLGTWSSTYLHCNSVWRHSDGTYRMIANGKGADNLLRIGMLQSNNLETWSWINGQNYLYEKFDTPWSTTAGIYLTSSPVKYGNDFIALAAGYNSNGWATGWILFDEDFNIKAKAATQLLIPGVATPQANQGSLAYYKGKFHAFVVHRDGVVENWKLYHIIYKDIFNYVVESSQLIASSTTDKSWTGNHIDTAVGIVYNNELNLLVGGTGLRNDPANLFSNKRSQGLMVYDPDNNSWAKDYRNPVIAAPIEGENWWGEDILYTTGHMGGYFAHMVRNGKLFIFSSFSDGTDTYKPNGFVLDLKKTH